MNGRAISFGPYRLFVAQRLLLEGDRQVRLGSRAFDILTALVERAGEVVSKEDLIARAWPATFVEEANLKIQVSALRRALGDGQGDNRYVATVVGRGYNFVAPIRKEEPPRVSPSPTVAPSEQHNLPFTTTRMIGREEIVATLVTQLSRRRLVTVVGPGGIGKTTVGLAVAERLIGAYEHGVWLVDLAPLRDPAMVPSAMATVLGLETRTEDPLPGLVAALVDNRTLLHARQLRARHRRGGPSGGGGAQRNVGRHDPGDQPGAARGAGRTRAPARAARQPGAVARADRHRSGGFPRRAAVRRASERDRRRLRADRCQRPADRRDLPAARRLAVGNRVRRGARRGARHRRHRRRPQ